MFSYDLTVRFSDCDPMGHVNNAVYYSFFEEARADVFKLFNPNLTIHTWNVIVASTRCDYLQEAVYAQELTVLTWIGKIGRSSFEVEHAIHDKKGNWIARGEGTLLGYDFETKKSIPLTDEKRALLTEHQFPPEGVPSFRE
ncbi:thioesterase family protein [Pullulanibacillus sp. KACC 23026]|uniref:acyl-CoA thioesterase n=1 Tax=Pullulanibacillus sp. KACC 23026 TaxID=3028315 RepID=UPI0023AEAF17|nr:thioesterase family protein [Pullulanibacillus sp. KACC 23026]WEG14293.1 thioesterase family protein [Pullulanibacillus sp. KACC 23026]